MFALAGDFDFRHIERLGVDVAIDLEGEQLAELIRGYVRRSQDCFAEIRSGSRIVVLRGQKAR